MCIRDRVSTQSTGRSSGARMPKPAPHREFERVPGPGQDDFNAADPVARRLATEQRNRDHWVLVEQAKMVRESLKECYRREGVNYQQNCADGAIKYMSLVAKLKAKEYGPMVANSSDE
eukprot:TRINITY_DN523_c0_g1_i1.p2 TRINITY_DN523_c0_g1~~TRINITY_DN523_c0_g1_i1.p2  ORF type:complete len:118 (+),score=36.01 TRINITY_DN523_c0_g1_i1:196-549(+)